MEAIQTQATEALVSLALAVISLLGAYGVFYIQRAAVKVKAQTAQIKDAKQRELLDSALTDVENLATVTVGAIEQTTASALRQAVKEGVRTQAELSALAGQAFDAIKSAIAPEAQEVISKNLGSFDTYLTNLIELKVLELKAATGRQ